jgi:Fe-S cluster assembly protein SufB
LRDSNEFECRYNSRSGEQDYKWGFVTEIDEDRVPKGLNEDIVRLISARKGEPEFMLEWRLNALRHWFTMEREQGEPKWANCQVPSHRLPEHRLLLGAQAEAQLDSLDQVDPELLRTYEKLGIPLDEQKRWPAWPSTRSSTASPWPPPSRASWPRWASSSARSLRRCRSIPTSSRSTWARCAAYRQLLTRRSMPPCSPTARLSTCPKGVRCPMELSTYFRINAAETGQFERTLIVADEGAYVSYLEGCTAPIRDENQLHAAVVELIALDNAQIKYSTVQNWYPGDKEGRGGIYNFVTKRGKCKGRNSKISWTQVETGSAITWKYPELHSAGRQLGGRVLLGGAHQQSPAGRHRHQDDPHRQEHAQHHRVQGHLGRPRPEHLSRPGQDHEGRDGRAQLHAVRLAADRRQVRRAHLPLHRGANGSARMEHEASTSKIGETSSSICASAG